MLIHPDCEPNELKPKTYCSDATKVNWLKKDKKFKKSAQIFTEFQLLRF